MGMRVGLGKVVGEYQVKLSWGCVLYVLTSYVSTQLELGVKLFYDITSTWPKYSTALNFNIHITYRHVLLYLDPQTQ